MECNPILEWLNCFQWEQNHWHHHRVVATLTLMLGVNRPLTGRDNRNVIDSPHIQRESSLLLCKKMTKFTQLILGPAYNEFVKTSIWLLRANNLLQSQCSQIDYNVKSWATTSTRLYKYIFVHQTARLKRDPVYFNICTAIGFLTFHYTNSFTHSQHITLFSANVTCTCQAYYSSGH